jgi:hypothetical protein
MARELPVEERERIEAAYKRVHWSVPEGRPLFEAGYRAALAAREEPVAPQVGPGEDAARPYELCSLRYEVRRATEELDRAGVEKYDNRESTDSTDESVGPEWSIQKRIELLAAERNRALATREDAPGERPVDSDGRPRIGDLQDTEREQGHRLDRVSFLSGYIQAATLMLRGIVKPDNDGAITMAAERAWKATGADTEREHEPLREDLCERCGGRAWVSESKLSDAPPIRIGPCRSCNADGAIPPPLFTGGHVAGEHEPAEDTQREWRAYGEQRGALAGQTTWTGPALKMGERLTVVPRSRAVTAEQHAEVLAKALDQFLHSSPIPCYAYGSIQVLREAVEPTLQALGYPKEET